MGKNVPEETTEEKEDKNAYRLNEAAEWEMKGEMRGWIIHSSDVFNCSNSFSEMRKSKLDAHQ